MMQVVSNATPIVSLCTVRHEWILKELFRHIVIPQAVEQELRQNDKPGATFNDADWVEVAAVENRDLVQVLRKDLDQGEAETIALAKQYHADVVLIDEAIGYQIARLYELPVVRTLYVLKTAKERRLIPYVKPIVEEMVRAGRWYSTRVIEGFLRDVGELR